MYISSLERSRLHAEFATEEIGYLVEAVRYAENADGLTFCYQWLSSRNISVAVAALFVNNDQASFKQHLHVASLLNLSALALNDYQRFTVGSELFYALLSDSPAVIGAMAKLEPPYFCEGRDNPLLSEFKVHMWQLAILGDYEALQKKVERLAKNGSKKDRSLHAQGKDFFSLLMRGEKPALETLITEHTKIKNHDALTEEFMCFEGTMESKICWLKGIQVQIDSPLLPMNLMPIAPLPHYDNVYDFLQPGYVPPKIGFFERLRYRLKQRANRRT